jgi:CheY-like chemotaxis protein
MNDEPIHILLADDDNDDCLLFEEALEELPLATRLSVVNDGEQLMHLLTKETTAFPFVIFLDLNMPRKNGLECLLEIKKNKIIKHIPIIMYSTSGQTELINLFYKHGAQYYIRKPAEFVQLKRVIHQALMLISKEGLRQSIKENFVITGELNIRINEGVIFKNKEEIKA